MFGMSCLLAWMWAFPLSGNLGAIVPNNEIFLSMWRILFFMGLALSFLTIGLKGKLRALDRFAYMMPWANLALTAAAVLPFLLQPRIIGNEYGFELVPINILYFSIAFLSGIVTSIYFIRWGTSLYDIDRHIRGRYMALMMAVAALLLSSTLYALHISTYIYIFAIMALPVFSFILSKKPSVLQEEPRKQISPPASSADPVKAFWVPFSLILLSFNILSGITHNTIFPLINKENYLAPMVGAIFYGLASLLCGSIIDKNQKIEKTAVIGLVLLGLSFLFLPLAVRFHLIMLLQIFMEVSYAFIDVFIWCSIAQSSLYFGKSPVRYLGIGLFINVFFILSGIIFDSIIKNIALTYNFFYLAIFAGALLFIGVFPALAIQSIGKAIDEQAEERSCNNRNINILLSGGVLTSKEKEVFGLMLRGLDNSSIQEKLGITKNTLKTHIGNIYGKTGVKNRRELFQKYII